MRQLPGSVKIFSCTEWYKVLAQPEERKLGSQRVRGTRGAPDPLLSEKNREDGGIKAKPSPSSPESPCFRDTEKEGHSRGWYTIYEEPMTGEKFIGMICDSVSTRGCDAIPGEVKEELWASKVDMGTRGRVTLGFRYRVLSPGLEGGFGSSNPQNPKQGVGHAPVTPAL